MLPNTPDTQYQFFSDSYPDYSERMKVIAFMFAYKMAWDIPGLALLPR